MSAQAARSANRSRPAHTWVLVAGAVAYLALALHAGMADAYTPNGRASVPAAPSSEIAAGFHTPALPDPCCIQHVCDTLAAVGPIVPSARTHVLRPPVSSPAIVGRVAAPLLAWAADPSARRTTRPLAGHRPLYLTSARLRL